jgi:hypothetical protein
MPVESMEFNSLGDIESAKGTAYAIEECVKRGITAFDEIKREIFPGQITSDMDKNFQRGLVFINHKLYTIDDTSKQIKKN